MENRKIPLRDKDICGVPLGSREFPKTPTIGHIYSSLKKVILLPSVIDIHRLFEIYRLFIFIDYLNIFNSEVDCIH